MARFVRLDPERYSLSGDRHYCTVVAIALTCDLTIEQAAILCARKGRKKRQGWHAHHAFQRWRNGRPIWAKVNGASVVSCKFTSIPLWKFLDQNREGRFIVSTRKHAMAVIDGAVVDHVQPNERLKLKRIIALKVPRRRKKREVLEEVKVAA